MRLDPDKHAFLGAPDTCSVMDALSPGETDRARFVGGAVRNALQGEPVEDVDMDDNAGAASVSAFLGSTVAASALSTAVRKCSTNEMP